MKKTFDIELGAILLKPPVVTERKQRQFIKVTARSVPQRLALVRRFVTCYRLEENKPDFDGTLKTGDLAYLVMTPCPAKPGYSLVLGIVVFTRQSGWHYGWHWLWPFARKRGLVAKAIQYLEAQYGLLLA